MRQLALFLILFTVSLTVRADSDWTKLLSIQFGLIDQLKPLSEKGDYAAIYSLLASEYQSEVTEEYFVRSSEELSWRIEDLKHGTSKRFKNFGWMPVRGTVLILNKKRLHFDTVVFLAKEGDSWKLVNFLPLD